jgi:hypothetical protein
MTSINVVDTCFIGVFKIGDNLRFNAKIVSDLYKASAHFNTTTLYKPKIVFNVALIEGAFYDFVRRVRAHTREFRYLDEDTRDKIRQLNLNKMNGFQKYIRKFEEWQIIVPDDIYVQLAELNKLRNRVHIQNENGAFEADDARAFTRSRLIQSEKCAEYCLKYLAKNYPRSHDFIGGIELPWKGHFDDHLRWR